MKDIYLVIIYLFALVYSGDVAQICHSINCKFFIVGDSAYALHSFIVTPYMNLPSVSERRYNAAHKSTRNVIERTQAAEKMLSMSSHEQWSTPIQTRKLL